MNWKTVPLDEIQANEPRAITDGPFGSNLARRHYTESGPTVIRLQNIGDGVYIDSPAHISEAHFMALRAHEVLPGDLLVSSLGVELPRACLAPAWLGPAIVKADCIRVRLTPEVDSRWVMYSMQRPAVRRWADERRHGVGRPRLGLMTIRQIPVPLPPLEDQRRIVDILEDHLSRLGAAESYLRACERRRKLLVKALLLELVPDVRAYPNGWRSATIGTAGSVVLGRQRHPDWHTGLNMRPYLRVANVFEDRIDTRDVKQMHWPDGTFERFRLQPGDVLLNEGQTPDLLGRPALYRGSPEDVAFTNSILRFQAHDDVLPEFALLVFRRHLHAGRFKRESRITTNIAHLSVARLKPIEFPIPPLHEQHRIVAVAERRFEEIGVLATALDQQASRSARLRRALLAAAFSGQLTGRSSDAEAMEEVTDAQTSARAAE